MKVAVTGTGYVGLITGVCLASVGHDVTCIDVDKEKIERLRQGIPVIFEPGLQEMLKDYKDHLTFTTDDRSAYAQADVIFICVGTPEKKDGSANLKYVYQVASSVSESLNHYAVVVVKSTVPIGTNDKIEKLIAGRIHPGISFDVVSNPEFLSQGTAIRDTLHGSRIVIGSESEQAVEIMTKLYDPFHIPYVVTDRRSAEMIKYASNDFLALKISYINEISNLCEQIGGNIEDIARGMGLDPRIGSHFLKAGVGYGGSCFPKDTKALHWLSNYNDCELKTVKAAIEVNENQKIKLLKKSKKYYESLDGKTVAILGLTFKPETDDLREAPSLINMPILLDEGANIKAWDPIGVPNFKKFYPTEITYCDSIDETLQDADICFIFTEWSQVLCYDLSKFAKLMRHPIIIDGRNCFKLDQAENEKIIYDSIGRKCILNLSEK